MSRTVAVLGGGKDSLGILRRIKEMGLRTLVFDGDKDAPAREHLADHFVNISCYDPWHICHYLALQTAVRFEAVLSGGTDTPDVIASMLHARGMPGIKSRTAQISKNKWLQKKLFSKAGVRIPAWTAGHNARGFIPDADCVVKPTKNRGSRGVSRVRAGESLDKAIELAISYDPQEHVIIEDWIDGIQLSSESLVQDGKIIYTAYSQRNYSRLDETYPYVIEDGGDMPPDISSHFDNDYQQKARAELQKCVDTMCLKCGTLKGDLVWDGNRVWIIEVACRLSGGKFCSGQIPEVWGVDFIGHAVRLALGEHIYEGEIRPYFRRYMSQRFVIPEGVTSHPERGPGFTCFGQTREKAQHRAERAVKNELRNM